MAELPRIIQHTKPMKSTTITAIALTALLTTPAVAQDTVPQLTDDNGSKLEFKRTDAAVKEILNRHRPAENKAIPAPSFALKTKNNKFIMTIGGNINLIFGYDIGNNLYRQPGAGISFVTSAIPVPELKGHATIFPSS